MKILIITQKVDLNDDLLGTYHNWLKKFAEKFEKINVICLYKGEHNLPSNVSVYSLGKEEGKSRTKYLKRFFYYIWKLRNEYEVVFVHMNQEYIILGGLFWRLTGKKTALWYNHHHGNLMTEIAVRICHIIFHTSPFAYTARFKKAKIMPAGIDIELFKKNENIQKVPNSILYLGRISPIKKLEVLVEAANLLDKANIDFVLNIVGEAGERDYDYWQKIKNLSNELQKKGKIKFFGEIPNYKTPEIYNQNEILVNLSPPGLFDKTILEAMACQTLVLVCSQAFENILPFQLIFKEEDAKDLAQKIIQIFELPPEEKQAFGKKLRAYVIKEHNLDDLITKIVDAYKD